MPPTYSDLMPPTIPRRCRPGVSQIVAGSCHRVCVLVKRRRLSLAGAGIRRTPAVERATPAMRAISRTARPPSRYIRITSRTWRIFALLVGIHFLPAVRSRKHGPNDQAHHPKWWAGINRNGGRDQLGIPGGNTSEWWARSPRNPHCISGRGEYQATMGGRTHERSKRHAVKNPKITLQNWGHPPNAVAQTGKVRSARSIARL